MLVPVQQYGGGWRLCVVQTVLMRLNILPFHSVYVWVQVTIQYNNFGNSVRAFGG
jgi:hypothetical protein